MDRYVDRFAYVGGRLMAEEVALADIAADIGTPFYCYSTAALEDRYRAFAGAFADWRGGRGAERGALIAYSVKANPNQAVIATLARLGAGADVVSEGEVRRALAAGVAPGDVVFSGVGKTRAEIAFALSRGVVQLNVESEPELELVSEVAAARGAVARVALRINPDVDAGSHDKISTGRRGDKFGVGIARARALYRRAAALPGVEADGVAMHIGSQIVDLAPFRRAFARAAELARRLRADGHRISRLDLGGGLGVRYGAEAPPSPAAYAALAAELAGGLGCRLILEPGRAIAADAGVLVAAVLYDKREDGRRFAVVDAAMNDLLRPALYGAEHRVAPVAEPAPDASLSAADAVGPVCESGDRLAAGAALPPLAPGDLVAFLSAGAYGAAMASTYNSRLLVPEVLVRGARYAAVRPRMDYDTLIGRDRLPDWLRADGPRLAATA